MLFSRNIANLDYGQKQHYTKFSNAPARPVIAYWDVHLCLVRFLPIFWRRLFEMAVYESGLPR